MSSYQEEITMLKKMMLKITIASVLLTILMIGNLYAEAKDKSSNPDPAKRPNSGEFCYTTSQALCSHAVTSVAEGDRNATRASTVRSNRTLRPDEGICSGRVRR